MTTAEQEFVRALSEWLESEANDGGWNKHSAREAALAVMIGFRTIDPSIVRAVLDGSPRILCDCGWKGATITTTCEWDEGKKGRFVKTASSSRTSFFVDGEQVWPCRCGQVHTGAYGLYDWAHHNCLHDEPLLALSVNITEQVLCPLCGKAWGLYELGQERSEGRQ